MGKVDNNLPQILYEGKYTEADLKTFKSRLKIWSERDIFLNQKKELFEIENPHLVFSPDYNKKLQGYINKIKKKNISLLGNWVYYPWSGVLIHTVGEDEYFRLRTNRNRELITIQQQKNLYGSCIAIIGLSIGSSSLMGLVYSGVGKKLKIADFDKLETTNLNRLKAKLDDVGTNKLDISARQIYEIDPYAKLTLFTDGINDENLNEIFKRGSKPNVIIEAIDDLKMKVKIRLKAREHGIPLLMFTNLGDGVLIDVERYDLDNKLKLFNGRIGDVPEKILKARLSKKDINRYVMQIVGIENIPPRAIKSVQLIGEKLVGRPQLFSTVNISGSVAAYMAREIVLGRTVKSGRKLVKFTDTFLV